MHALSNSAWWAPLLAAFPSGDVPTEELFKTLIGGPGPWVLTGIAAEGDPFVAGFVPTLHARAYGAVVLSGVTLVCFETNDEYSSVCAHWRIVPGEHLRTVLPPFPVRAEAADSTRWDAPEKNQGPVPKCLALVSTHTGDTFALLGTSYGDPYYPQAEACFFQVAMTAAAPLAMAEHLSGAFPAAAPNKARRRL